MIGAVAICGLTGSGKSTIAKGVSQQCGWPVISSGDIARELAQADRSARATLAAGNWAPELAIRHEVTAQIEAAVAQYGGFIIEGFPRRLEQLIILEQVRGIDPLYVHLTAPPLVCFRRLIARDRPDDHPDALAVRFRSYTEHTLPMLDAVGRDLMVLDATADPAILVTAIMDEWRWSRH